MDSDFAINRAGSALARRLRQGRSGTGIQREPGRHQRMSNLSLTEFANKIREKKLISFGDVQRLRRDILPDGIGCRGDVEFLLGLDRYVTRADSAWSDFLVAVVVQFVVWAERPTGIVDNDTALWLAAALGGEGAPTRTARLIAREIIEEAQTFETDALAALAAKLAKADSRRPGPDLEGSCGSIVADAG